jgi:hypothetical protein
MQDVSSNEGRNDVSETMSERPLPPHPAHGRTLADRCPHTTACCIGCSPKLSSRIRSVEHAVNLFRNVQSLVRCEVWAPNATASDTDRARGEVVLESIQQYIERDGAVSV